MNSFGLDNELEYNKLISTYKSEGFGIYLRLLDSVIGQLYNKVVDDKTDDATVIKLVNQIKGLGVAKNICFNAIKENEFKFKKD
jgi:hypothetical protein